MYLTDQHQRIYKDHAAPYNDNLKYHNYVKVHTKVYTVQVTIYTTDLK